MDTDPEGPELNEGITMQCSSCGASSPDSATFCSLCLTPFPGASPYRQTPMAVAGPGRGAAAAAVPHPALVAISNAEHEWWVRRRAEHVHAMETGLPTAGSTYALVAFDGQIRYNRALWWSASIFTVFAWLAALRIALVDWATPSMLDPSIASAAVLQAVLIGIVGIAAACVCAAFVSGSEAWRTTLVHAVFWSVLAVLLACIAAFGGVNGVQVVNALGIGTAIITAIMPFTRGTPGRRVPRA